jgi:hypothetical protein
MRRTLACGRCSFGPFRGEFGHLLGHILPFITFLHSRGVKVEYCGMDIYEPFFRDAEGKPIVEKYIPIPDYFSIRLPDSNKAKEPADAKKISDDFIRNARGPFWDISDDHYYFYCFRWWALKKNYARTIDLSRLYKTRDEDACVIFPRSKGAGVSKNNGEEWDYRKLAERVAPWFGKVYVLGHPAYSTGFSSFGNVEVLLTTDNKVLLEKCSNSKLIITQHSGTVYLGEYTNTPVLIIYKGGKVIGDIGITRQFKQALGNKFEFNYAFDYAEIDNFIKNRKGL